MIALWNKLGMEVMRYTVQQQMNEVMPFDIAIFFYLVSFFLTHVQSLQSSRATQVEAY